MNKQELRIVGKNCTTQTLRAVLREYSDTWRQDLTVSWTEMYQTGETLLAWKREENISGLWGEKPTMITATLEDGIGQGLKMIHLFSQVAGIDVVSLGLMQTEESIINACIKQAPDFLGMTVLQLDSEERLSHIVDHIPKETQVVVGGPIFNMMDSEDLSKKRYLVLNTVSVYLDFLLDWQGYKHDQLHKL